MLLVFNQLLQEWVTGLPRCSCAVELGRHMHTHYQVLHLHVYALGIIRYHPARFLMGWLADVRWVFLSAVGAGGSHKTFLLLRKMVLSELDTCWFWSKYTLNVLIRILLKLFPAVAKRFGVCVCVCVCVCVRVRVRVCVCVCVCVCV